MAGRASHSWRISQSGLVEFRLQEGCVIQGSVGRCSARSGMTCPAICSSRYMGYTFGLGVLRDKAAVMAGRASARRRIADTSCVERHSQECREYLRRGIRMAAGACRPGRQRNMYRTIDRDYTGILPLMAGSTGGTRCMRKSRPQERRVARMAGIAVRRSRAEGCQGEMGRSVVTDHVGISTDRAGLTCRTAVALETVADITIRHMIDLVAQESAGIFVAVFARLLGREVIRRFAHDTQRLSVVASRALTGYGDMAKAFYQEAGCADMAGVTRKGCWNMVYRLGKGGDSRSGVVAACTVLGSVLEYSVDVTLFAFQCCMNFSENKSCFRVVEGVLDCDCLCCSREE